MSTKIQVVVDAIDPHAQADFWAAAIGHVVEDTTSLIEELRDASVIDESDFFERNGKLCWNDLVGIRDPDGAQPRLLFQRTSEAKPTARNRLHLDLNVGGERRAEEVARLEALGARILYEIDEPGGRHTTMADPEGNELCVQ